MKLDIVQFHSLITTNLLECGVAFAKQLINNSQHVKSLREKLYCLLFNNTRFMQTICVCRSGNRQIENNIIKLFKNKGLKITIDTSIAEIDFCDVIFIHQDGVAVKLLPSWRCWSKLGIEPSTSAAVVRESSNFATHIKKRSTSCSGVHS